MYDLQLHRVFTPLDEVLPAFYFCFCLCFPLDLEKSVAVDLLSQSASSIATQRPYLTATVRRVLDSKVRKGHLVLDLPETPEAVPITFNDLTDPGSEWQNHYADLKHANMPPTKLDAHLLAPLTAGIGETRKVMSIQANFIPGGLILAFCFHHNFVDAYGAGRIIARFSEFCHEPKNGGDDHHLPVGTNGTRGDTIPESVPDVLDIHQIKQQYRWEDVEPRKNLWQLNCLDFRGINDFRWPEFIPSLLPAKDPPVVSSLLLITSESLADLKRLAQPSGNGAWVSTNDTLAAFFWRHVMRARFPVSSTSDGNTKDTSSVIVALNGRKDLRIPPSYIGNVLFHCYTPLPIDTITSRETPLSKLAVDIRGTITAARDPALMKDVIGLAATHPDVQTIRYANNNLTTDLYTTSWAELPVYDLNWGPLGKAEFFRIPDRQFESLCCILPKRNGTTEIITSMRKDHSERLQNDLDFRKYVKVS